MKNALYPFVIALIFLALQAALFNNASLYGVKPNFILIEIIFISLYRKPFPALIITMGLGYLVDFLSGSVIGITIFLGVVVFSLVKLIEWRFIVSNYTLRIVLVSIATFVYEFGWIVIHLIFKEELTNKIYLIFFIHLILQIFVNAIFTYPVWFVLEKIEAFNVKQFSAWKEEI